MVYRGVPGYTTDPAKISQFFTWYPTANFGVAMGRTSGHFVIESDGPQGEAFVQSLHLPPTPTVISRRGFHRYLKIPPGYGVKTRHIGELDIIGDGDQVIGPGSLHASGHVYIWHEYLSLKDIEPADPPERLIAWLTERGVLHFDATQLYQQNRSRPQKAASRAFSPRNEQTQLPLPEEHRRNTTNSGGGSKTRALLTTPRLVTPTSQNVFSDLAKKPDLFGAMLALVEWH
jgi:hypothetical protein